MRVVRFSFIEARGVGHIFTWTERDVGWVRLPPIRSFMARCASGDFPSSRATGVPQYPDTFPFVRRSNVGRTEQTPFRIEPVTGKVTEDDGQRSLDEAPYILQEHEARDHLTDDSVDVRPEPTVIFQSSSKTGITERLAWKAGSDDIHLSTPRTAVEGFEVRPDRSLIQGLVFHPRHEYGRCVGFPLNVSHGSALHSGELESKLEASIAGAEVQGT